MLVYGIEGWIPALYLDGAAWAQPLAAQGVMAIMAFVLLYSKTDISLVPRGHLNPELAKADRYEPQPVSSAPSP